jgi:predicted CopG family antitoxin
MQKIINTLAKVKRLLGEVGLSEVIAGGVVAGDKSLNDVMGQLLEGGKTIEFLEIITRNTEVDFGEMEPEEVQKLVSNFFTAIKGCLPESLQTKLQNTVVPKGMSS